MAFIQMCNDFVIYLLFIILTCFFPSYIYIKYLEHRTVPQTFGGQMNKLEGREEGNLKLSSEISGDTME